MNRSLAFAVALSACGPTHGDPPDAGVRSGEGGGGVQLTGVVRDFHESHPDFERPDFAGAGSLDDRGIVAVELGADGTPQYAGPAEGTRTTSGPAAFGDWYHDVDGVNLASELVLELTPSGNGVFTYANDTFFPIDGRLFGDEGRPHNYHFTFELGSTFAYGGGEQFTFSGDDDLWIFIDRRLVIDLGGVHAREQGTVDIDALAEPLGLQIGGVYRLDLFFAERHVTESHFRIDTSIDFVIL